MTVDAGAWDIDGTLLDSEPLHRQAPASRMWEPIG
jgi:beta-phosphoglucomutase-like phosphatase (HAD superfamily)